MGLGSVSLTCAIGQALAGLAFSCTSLQNNTLSTDINRLDQQEYSAT